MALGRDPGRPATGGPPAGSATTLPALDDPTSWWGAPFTPLVPESPLVPVPPPVPETGLAAPGGTPGFEAEEAGDTGRPDPLVVGGGALAAAILLGVGYLIWRKLPSRYLPA